ncbi:MAG: flagellar export protein FliJ [Pseudomonadota bacterium]
MKKLLKVARAKTDEASRRIGDLQSALEQTQRSLRLLEDAVASEEAAMSAAEIVGFVHLAGYLAGAAQKRAAMTATRADLEAELETARTGLSEAFAEMKRLELLIERARLHAEKSRRKAESGRADEAAIMRFTRTNAR